MRTGSRLVISCEHASCEMPEVYPARVPASILRSHMGWDKHAGRFAVALGEATGSSVFLGSYSRLLVDLNRSEDSGEIWSRYSRKLSEREKSRILKTLYRPFRHRVFERIRKLNPSIAHPVLHLSIHSFTPVLRGQKRPYHLGILFDPKSPVEVEVARAIKSQVKAHAPNLVVAFNKPYLGTEDGHTNSLRKAFGYAYAGIEIELRQNLSVSQRFSILMALEACL